MKRNYSRQLHKSSRPPTRLRVETPAALLDFLLSALPDQGRNNIKSLLTHRQVAVGDNVTSQHNYPLQPGDEVVINWGLVRDQGRTGRGGLHIIYEDDAILVIDKPPGLLSIATDSEKSQTAYHQLTDYVRENDPHQRIFIVHRLDRDTSGLMVFAKSEPVKRILQDGWKEMVVDRAYVALVEGRPAQSAGKVRSWLRSTKTGLIYSSSTPGDGLEAVTHYQVLKAGTAFSLLEIRLETGRKNQIRVHMKDLGHPIAGDKKYGAAANPIGRLGLHAHLLAFYHPLTRELLRFETEIPSTFTRLVK